MKTMTATFFAAALVFTLCAAAPDPMSYQPDLSKSDIYLPHLKRMPLSGWWKVKKVSSDRKNDPNDPGQTQKFFAKNFDDSTWRKDLVPNEIHVPFSLKEKARSTGWLDRHRYIPREVREWGGIMYFRRNFIAPKLGKNERAVLFFNEVAGDFTVYVNGKKVGQGIPYVPPTGYRGPQDTYEFDITNAILPGKDNNITVRLFHSGAPVRWGWAGKAGILDLVYLDIRPAAYTANVLVTPQKNLKDVQFECILSGSKAPDDTNGWTGEIFEWKSGKNVASVRFGKEFTEDGLRMVSGTAEIKQAKRWSWGSPFLYGLRVKNARGEVTGVQRFGVRTFGVKDGNFILNGQAVALRGLTHHGQDPFPLQTHGWLYALRTNTDDTFRKYWKITGKDANVNHIRVHSSTFSRNQYDMLDEYGIIVTDELAYPETRIKNPVRSDMIDVKGFDGACDKQGNLHPEFVSKVKARIRRAYSHPSMCTYSFGNEIRQYDDPRVENLLNNLYDLFKKVDKQQRPTTNSSGRFWKDGTNVKEMHEREKLDYIDTHDYTGSINNFPLAYCEPVIKHFTETVRKHYGSKMPPIINGETVYMANHYHGNVMDPIWKNENDPQPDWNKILYMFNQWSKDHPDQSFLGYYWVRNWGVKNYKFNRPVGRGIYTERILEAQRKAWPAQDGYENLCDPYFTFSAAWPFKDIAFTKNEAYPYLARVNSPVLAVLDYVAPNRFTGEEFHSNVTALNNSEKDLDSVIFESEIRKDGKILSTGKLNFGTLPVNAKKVLPISWKTPSEPGKYMLVYRLTSNGKVLNERDRWLNIRNRDDAFKKIDTKKRIALYDASSVFGGLKPYSTDRVLKTYGVPFRNIRKFDDLKNFDILILGAESIDGRVQEGAESIRKFVEDGGRLLVFDQNFVGRIPFLPELEYILAGPGQFAEILKFDHPALKGMKQIDFFCWNQKDWSVYRTYLSPISRAALLTGGDTTQWGSDHFGMVAAHLKLGKGDILFSQAETTKTLKDDSAAAYFTRQLLNTILDDKTREKATDFEGLPVPKAKPLSRNKAQYLSLKNAANMAFADETARDGKGGWTDQGPTNDLSPMPLGERFFGGIPFEIINPAENGNRSCVVVSNNPTLKFQASSKPIAVNSKVKRLIFLHSGAWMNESKGTEAGDYLVNYASGKTLAIPLTAGIHIGDWWNASAKKFPKADCGWSAMNKSGVVGVYVFEWTNPNPEDAVRSVTVRAKNNAVIGLVGLTAEKK